MENQPGVEDVIAQLERKAQVARDNATTNRRQSETYAIEAKLFSVEAATYESAVRILKTTKGTQ